MINIICSLQNHKERKKSQNLCCKDCGQLLNRSYPIIKYSDSQQKILKTLINISTLSEELMSSQDDYRNNYLEQWNEIMNNIINSRCLLVKFGKFKFFDDGKIPLQQLQIQIGQHEFQLNQQVSQIQQQNKVKKLKFYKEPTLFDYQQQYLPNNVTLSSNGRIMAFTADNMIKIWDVQSQKLLSQFEHYWVKYCGIAISQNNQLLAYAGDKDSSIFLRGISNQGQKEDIKEFKGHRNINEKLIFDQNSNYLILSSDIYQIYIYDINKHTLIYKLTCQYSIIIIDLSPENNFLSSISEFGHVEIWNFTSRNRLIKKYVHNSVKDLNFSKRSYLLITSGWEQSNLAGTIKIWKMVGMKNQLIRLFQIKVDTNSREIERCCFFSDQLFMSTNARHRQIQIYKVESRVLDQSLDYLLGSYFDEKLNVSSQENLIIFSGRNWMQVWRGQYK